jgi:hypothetical protein
VSAVRFCPGGDGRKHISMKVTSKRVVRYACSETNRLESSSIDAQVGSQLNLINYSNNWSSRASTMILKFCLFNLDNMKASRLRPARQAKSFSPSPTDSLSGYRVPVTESSPQTQTIRLSRGLGYQ